MAKALPLLRSRLLSAEPAVIHGLTARVPDLGLAYGNVGYSPPRDTEDAWAMRRAWAEAAALDAETIVVGRQIHGKIVLLVGAGDAGRGARPGTEPIGFCDALVTDESGVTLMTLHADCLPILLYARDRNVVASVHAGWRGTVEDVAGEAVRTMEARFGVDPGNIVAFLGPTICTGCYEVGEDVVESWAARLDSNAFDAIASVNEMTVFDLAGTNQFLLERAGVQPSQIERSAICTKCNGDRWFSHRGQGPTTGRFGAMIALKR
jgi:polyphenol oxidase